MAETALPDGVDGERSVRGVAPFETAGPDDLAYMDNPAYARPRSRRPRPGSASSRRALPPKFRATTIADRDRRSPIGSSRRCLALLFPSAPAAGSSAFAATGISPGSFVHPTARLEQGVTVDPGAVVGPRRGRSAPEPSIGAQAVIGPHVRIGRDCSIGPNVTISHAFIGNRVILHPGVRIGQDGFGFAMGPQGPPEGPAGRARHHPGRRRDRRQHDGRPRREPRHGDRRGHQDRQPRADRPQRRDRPPLRDRRPGRHCRLDDGRGFRRHRRTGRGAGAMCGSVPAPRSRRPAASTATCRPAPAGAASRRGPCANGSARSQP